MPASDRTTRLAAHRLEGLLAAGRDLAAGLDLETLLLRIVAAARDLTGARSATLEVLDQRDPGQTRAVTDGPAAEPRSEAAAVLRAPVTARGEAAGTLSVTGADFDDEDRETIAVLAGWAAVAIDTARLHDETLSRGAALERALRTMRSATEIATAVGSDTDLTRILTLIAKRARSLVDADGLLIWLRHDDELRIAAVAGNADVPHDATISVRNSSAGGALLSGRPIRVDDAQRMDISPAAFGMPQATSSLIVPLVHRGQGLGVMVAFDRMGADASFDDDNERALEAFAAGAATAVATARLVEAQRLHDTMAASEAERGRWARELHDETLQGLASLKLALSVASKAQPEQARAVLASAMAQLDHDIAALHAIISDLRPAALDELGLEPALRTLAASVTDAAGLTARVGIELGDERLSHDVETTTYRVAQAALTNVVKHAEASSVSVRLELDGRRLRLLVEDDGRGVGTPGPGGYGLIGMRERAALAGGDVEVATAPGGGTRVTLVLPLD